MTKLLARIVSMWKRNRDKANLLPAIIPETSQRSLQSSTKVKILSFPDAEVQLNARIPGHLEVFESGEYIFLREAARVEGRSLHSIELRVLHFRRIHAW